MDESSKKFPSLDQFRESVQDLLHSLDRAYDPNDGSFYFGSCVYIDPIRRMQENLPPWYVVLPIGTYDRVVDKNDAQIDQLNNGGVVISNQEFDYEIFRIDYFSKPHPKDIDCYLKANPNIIGRFEIDIEQIPIGPGFGISNKENKANKEPIFLTIYNDPMQIQSSVLNFSKPDKTGLLSTKQKMFNSNISMLLHDLHDEKSTQIRENGQNVAFKQFIPQKNHHFWCGQPHQLILKN